MLRVPLENETVSIRAHKPPLQFKILVSLAIATILSSLFISPYDSFPWDGVASRKLHVQPNIVHASTGSMRYWPKYLDEEEEEYTEVPLMDVTPLDPLDFPPQFIKERRNKFNNKNSNSQRDKHYEKQHSETVWPQGKCTVTEEWMKRARYNCNAFHEIGLASFYQGYYMSQDESYMSWMVSDYDGTHRVLKTDTYIPRHGEIEPFDLHRLERHRRNGIAMEQLSNSNYIADIYGHCAQASFHDYASGPSLQDIFDGEEDDHPTYDQLFQVAHDVVAAVADVHHYNNKSQATMVHMGIQPNQWIYANDRFVLGDFGSVEFLTRNKATNNTCGKFSGKGGGRWQSPDQYKQKILSEKTDVYSLGNVLYYLLTNGTKPFPTMGNAEAFEQVGRGAKPKITKPLVLKSKHPFHVAVLKVMKKCFDSSSTKRPSAEKIRDYLRLKLNEHIQKLHQALVAKGAKDRAAAGSY